MTNRPSRLRAFVLTASMVAVVAGCSDDLGTGAHTTPDVTPDSAGALPSVIETQPSQPDGGAAETPAPTPKPAKPVTFKGSGSKKTKPFQMASPAKIDLTHAGSGNFIVVIYDTDGNVPIEFITNDIGKLKVTTWTYSAEGKVYFDVLASGKWTIAVTQMSPTVKQVPVEFGAKIGLTTVPFAFEGDVTVTYTHSGSGNFIVQTLDAATGDTTDFTVNEIGKVSGETQLYGLSGEYAFNVTADGAWTTA